MTLRAGDVKHLNWKTKTNIRYKCKNMRIDLFGRLIDIKM